MCADSITADAASWETTWRAGDAAAPGLDLGLDELIAYWQAREVAPGDAPAEDLYLAAACARNKRGAVEAFERRFGGDLRAIVSRFGGEELREETLAAVRRHLFVSGDRPARIADYAGRGSLLAYVRIVTVRLGLDRARAERRAPDRADDDLDTLADAACDPELAYLKRLYRDELRRAFATAVEALPPRARTLLRYHLVDHLGIDRIGAIYGVHRATAARWLDRARAHLVAGTRRALLAQLRVDRVELDSIMRLIASDLHVSAARLLNAATHP